MADYMSHVPSEMVNYVWLNTTIHTHNMLYNGMVVKHRGIDRNMFWGPDNWGAEIKTRKASRGRVRTGFVASQPRRGSGWA